MEIGKYNKLRVVKEVDFGIYLDGGSYGEILMPKRYVPKDCKPDDEIEVFIYLDSEDRFIATSEKPYGIVGEFALLKVASINRVGAFLNWGLPKDLLVPFKEQKAKMEEDKSYVVYIYVDTVTQRIAASSNLDKFLDNTPPEYEENQEVDLLISNPTEIGYKVIINNLHWGMLYKNEVFQKLRRGQKIKGFIKKVREDEKIDVCLQKPGFEKIDTLTDTILQKLNEYGGFIIVNDKSSSEEIYELFGTSKKTFKKSVGALYKKRLISIEEKGIRLVTK
ncbi:MAG TPA: GntR family transcriptional regulator [Bacteroidales bacterium]|nr:MAG: GntR family transcriptional regulator [Bacteroidetes bacterium GWF2_33_38]HBF89478.1 GntR family transcriptional regulator [Bacteroidales bacterium]